MEEGKCLVLSVTHVVLGSPLAKSLQMRMELIDQLKKWHSLLHDAGITQAQYDDLQEKTLKDTHGI